ncbi:hypothetical protein [Pseudomonas aeruginosa]|uniref:hypothetical protein n=1 Tax=Pseudomonas aeruginosa TaxID=287 RepID=UPI003747C018
MSSPCPRCNSPKVTCSRQAMKVTATIGTIGGAVQGAAVAFVGSRFGASLCNLSRLGPPFGSLAGRILGGLAGGVAGCAFGAQLGDKLDRHVLAHNQCQICGHRFNLPVE